MRSKDGGNVVVFTRIDDSRKSKAIVKQIIDYIISARLRPGDKLPSEPEMMEIFGVGRSSIREAKQILGAKHILEITPGKGTRVREIRNDVLDGDILRILVSKETLEDIYEVREILEPKIARLAAKRAQAEDIALLKTVMDRMSECVKLGTSVYELGLEFHITLSKATQNTVLVRLFHPVAELLHQYQKDVYLKNSDPGEELQSHQGLFDAIANRDPIQAERLMHKHLRQARIVGFEQTP